MEQRTAASFRRGACILVLGTLAGLAPLGCGVLPAVAGSQTGPWKPPATSAPKEYVEAVQFLLANGLADPRGGKFVEAVTPSTTEWVWDEQERTLGWLTSDGRELTTIRGGRVKVLKVIGDRKEDLPEPPRLTHGDYALAPAMFLIRGKPGLAETNARGGGNFGYFDMLSKSFLGAWLQRVVAAHSWGRDQEALDQAKALLAVRPAFEKRASEDKQMADQLDLIRQNVSSGRTLSGHYAFLDVLPELIRDSERRLKAGGSPKTSPQDIKATEARIKALIHGLEDVSQRQSGQPGGVDLVADPRVTALVKEGVKAAPALLEAMETDQRLTRSYSFARDFRPERRLIPVRSACRAALEQIIGVDLRGEDGQPAGISEWRAYFEATRGMSPQERWLMQLADDRGGIQNWRTALLSLFDPEDVTRSGYFTMDPRYGTKGRKLKAEALRGKTGPSLSEVLANRARAILAKEGLQSYDLDFALSLGLRLTEWDKAAGIPVLQEAFDRVISLKDRRGGVSEFGRTMAQAVILLTRSGNKKAAEDWASWIRGQVMPGWSGDVEALLPLEELRSEPVIAKLSRDLFLSSGSALNPRTMLKSGDFSLRALILSRLLEVPEMREALDGMLSDFSPAFVAVVQGGSVSLSSKKGEIGIQNPGRSKEEMPENKVKAPLRLADVTALFLSALKGSPAFAPVWPEARRDQALAEFRKFLSAKGLELQKILPWPQNGRSSP